MTARHGEKIRSLFRRHGSRGEAVPGETQLLQAPAATAETEAIATLAAMEPATPVQGCGADGSPLVRDSLGVRPATWGEIYEHRDGFRAMGHNVSGMDALAAREVLPPDYDMHPAALAATAETGTFPAAQDIPLGEWDTQAAREEAAAIFTDPQAAKLNQIAGIYGPEVATSLAGLVADAAELNAERARMRLDEQDRTRLDARRNRPYTDDREADPTLVFRPVPWMPPVSGAESASVIARLTYPGPDATRERWAAWSRQMSAYTGTRSARDQPSGWPPVFRTGGPDEPLRVWDLRPAVLALPAGSGVAA